jgi:hypothetical protein
VAGLEVHRQEQRLDRIFDLVGKEVTEPEHLSHWGRYLCVLVSGYLEVAVRDSYTEYASKGNPALGAFVSKRLERTTNLKAQKCVDLAKSFKKEWGEGLETFLSSNGRKEALDSLVSIRNGIAHGRSVGITFTTSKQYFSKTTEVVKFIRTQLGF